MHFSHRVALSLLVLVLSTSISVIVSSISKSSSSEVSPGYALKTTSYQFFCNILGKSLYLLYFFGYCSLFILEGTPVMVAMMPLAHLETPPSTPPSSGKDFLSSSEEVPDVSAKFSTQNTRTRVRACSDPLFKTTVKLRELRQAQQLQKKTQLEHDFMRTRALVNLLHAQLQLYKGDKQNLRLAKQQLERQLVGTRLLQSQVTCMRQQRIMQLTDQLQIQKNQLWLQKARHESQRNYYAQTERVIQKRERRIAQLQGLVRKQQDEIKTRDRRYTGLMQQQAVQHEIIAQRNERIQALRTSVAQRNKELDQLKQQLSTRKGTVIQSGPQQLSQLKKTVNDQCAEIKRLLRICNTQSGIRRTLNSLLQSKVQNEISALSPVQFPELTTLLGTLRTALLRQ